jgi:hypothetical protein
MTDFFNKAIAWIKANLILSIVIGIAVIFIFFGRGVKKLFGPTYRARHHRSIVRHITRRKSLPRSAGTHKMKSTPKKKPWQVKGSLAARKHMAQIRRMR